MTSYHFEISALHNFNIIIINIVIYSEIMGAIYTILTKQGKYKDKSIKLHMLGDSKFGNGYLK